MKFQKVAILGIGAVGSYLLRGLSQKSDIDLCVIADGARRERLERDGLVINDTLYKPVVRSAVQARGVNLLLIALKYNALEAALPEIAEIADEHTVIMSLMNGVDSEEIIGSAVGIEKTLPALIKVASRRVGNTIRFDPETTIGIIYGESDPARGRERVDAVTELFSGTDMHYRATDHIYSEMWAKFRLNVGMNQAQAMIGCGVGAYRDSEHLAFLRDALRAEVDALAAAKGIDMNLSDASSTRGSKVADTARYSTLQDLDAKRHTEVDMFAGAIVRMGKELGIPTPYNETAYHIIKALEQKNDGLFDYE